MSDMEFDLYLDNGIDYNDAFYEETDEDEDEDDEENIDELDAILLEYTNAVINYDEVDCYTDLNDDEDILDF